MRKVNVKLFLWLMGGTALFGIGLFLVHYFQSGRIASALLWQARHAEEQGDLGGTVRYLGRYLEFQPDDHDERARLGLTLADPKLATSWRTCQRALFVLERVVSEKPERHDLRKPAARLAIELGRLDVARSHLDVLVKACPRDGEVQFLQGQWHEAQARDLRKADKYYRRAVTCYRQAIALSPRQTIYAVRLASLLHHRLDRTEEAKKVLHQARKQAPDDAGVLLMSASLAQEDKALTPAQRLAEAKTYIDRGRKLHPHDPKFYEAQVSLLIGNNQRGEAIDCLRHGLNTLPSQAHPDLIWTLANLFLDLNEQEEARLQKAGLLKAGKEGEAQKEIARLRKVNPRPGQVDYLLARLCMCRGQWSKAAHLLQRIRPQIVGVPQLTTQIDVFLGQCYERLDQWAQCLDAYKRAVEEDPRTVPRLSALAQAGLASAQWAMGQHDNALDNFRQAAAPKRGESPPRAWIEYARRLVDHQRQQDNPNWKAVTEILEQAEAAQKEAYQAAIRDPRQAEAAQRGLVEIVLMRADVLAAQNRTGDAEKLLMQARTQAPALVEPWLSLMVLADNNGQPEKARQLLEEAESRLGDRAELRLARARYLVNQHGVAAHQTLLALADRTSAFTPQQQADLWRGLADAVYRIGKVEDSARLLSRSAALPLNQTDIRIRLRLFDLYLEAKDGAAMHRVVQQVRRLEGEQGTWWRYLKASQLVWQVKQPQGKQARRRLLDEAGQLLKVVKEQQKTWSAVLRALAEVEELKGNRSQAALYRQQAVALGEKSQWVYGPLLKEAQALLARGQPSPAVERQLRAAAAEAGTVPELWVTLVQYQVITGHKDRAEESLRRAERALTSEQGLLALGQCYEAVGQLNKARDAFQDAYRSKPRDVQIVRGLANFYLRLGLTREAEPLLRDLLTGRLKATDSDLSWARRGLALVLASNNDFRQFKQALSLVGLSVDGSGRVSEDNRLPPGERDEIQRYRARVLATQGSRPFRMKAIAYLENLGRRQSLTPDDRFLLASLYEAQGEADWPRAEKLLRALLAEPAVNPAHLAHFAQGLILRRKLKEAEPYLARLEALEKARGSKPGALGSVALRARALEIAGANDQALTLLQNYAGGKDAEPEQVLVLAAYLARRHRLTEALDQCDRAWPMKAAPPEMVGGASVAALRSTQPTAAHCDHVERRLREALASNRRKPTSTNLLVQLADLNDLRGRVKEAEKLYRQVLADDEDKDNVMALNNLAWLLAHKTGKGKEALKLINHAIEVLGPRAELLDTRAVVYLALGRSRPAVTDLEQATADSPSAGRYFHLAQALHRARQSTRALDAFQKAKASGLELKRLHPAERAAYDKIAGDLERR